LKAVEEAGDFTVADLGEALALLRRLGD
jgi:hypothetical protein